MGFDTLEAAVSHFQSLDNAEFGEPASGTVGGASAATIDGNITANQSIMRLASGLTLQWQAGTETTLHIVDVEGDVAVIVVDGTAPVPLNFVEEAQSLLDSITWRALES
jgi:hypothetical protein